MDRGVAREDVASEEVLNPLHRKKTLRDSQVGLTRELILKATAEHALRDPLLEFSMQDIASEAGMHLRSVYRHFPTKRVLLESFFDWVLSQLDYHELVGNVHTLDDLPVLVREMYARAATMPENLRQATLVVGSMPLHLRHRQEAERLRDLFLSELPDLDRREAEHSFAVLRQLVSGRAVVPLASMPDPDGGEALAWAVSTLITALRARNAAAAATKGR